MFEYFIFLLLILIGFLIYEAGKKNGSIAIKKRLIKPGCWIEIKQKIYLKDNFKTITYILNPGIL